MRAHFCSVKFGRGGASTWRFRGIPDYDAQRRRARVLLGLRSARPHGFVAEAIASITFLFRAAGGARFNHHTRTGVPATPDPASLRSISAVSGRGDTSRRQRQADRARPPFGRMKGIFASQGGDRGAGHGEQHRRDPFIQGQAVATTWSRPVARRETAPPSRGRSIRRVVGMAALGGRAFAAEGSSAGDASAGVETLFRSPQVRGGNRSLRTSGPGGRDSHGRITTFNNTARLLRGNNPVVSRILPTIRRNR